MANVITSIRIACAVFLIFCPTFETYFYTVYIIGGISDVLDGIVARHFKKETKFGEKFDTIADICFYIVVLIKIILNVYFPPWLIIWILVILVIKIVNIIRGFIVYKKFVSEHTIMNKICGILLFMIPLCIKNFPLKIVMILTILTCIVATFASIEEGHYIRAEKENLNCI